MHFKTILVGYKPLCYIDDSTLLLSKLNQLFLYRLIDSRITFVAELNLEFFNRLFSKFSLMRRLLRLEFRNAIYVDENTIYLIYKNGTYRLSITHGQIEELSIPERGLHYSLVYATEGLKDGVYFGTYLENLNRDKKISINKIWNGAWSDLYNFPMKEVEHIHAVIPDTKSKSFWILTGDFDKAAGIWLADSNFYSIKAIFRGSQAYRSCVAFIYRDGLIYATDSQTESNSINLLSKIGDNDFQVIKLMDINGPCIYGTQIGGNHYFATSVEPYFGKNKLNIYAGLLSNIRAEVIQEPCMKIYKVNSSLEVTEIYQNEKDSYPFVFQFGSIMFPSNSLNFNHLVFFNMASKKNNLSTEIWNIVE
jgi:hypothetical protein